MSTPRKPTDLVAEGEHGRDFVARARQRAAYLVARESAREAPTGIVREDLIGRAIGEVSAHDARERASDAQRASREQRAVERELARQREQRAIARGPARPLTAAEAHEYMRLTPQAQATMRDGVCSRSPKVWESPRDHVTYIRAARAIGHVLRFWSLASSR